MSLFLEKIKNYFTGQPLPRLAIQLTSSYLSGIHVSPQEKKVKNHFILPLERGVIEPSFNQKNIKDQALLERRIKQGLERVRPSEHKIACLIPELSLKVFVFSFDSLPLSRKEREQIIRFRVKKQLPLLPEDARLSFDTVRSNNSLRVLTSVARASVISEYEDFFDRFNLEIRTLGVPSLSLNNLMSREKGEDFLLINVEEDFFSLVAALNFRAVLYRLKPFLAESQKSLSDLQRAENIVKEVENTVNFIEDRERKKVQSFWVRLGILERGEEIFSILKERFPFPLVEIETGQASGLNQRDRKILSPLLGQIL